MDSTIDNDQSVSRTDVNIMDVSPDAMPDTIPTDENKENDNAQLEQTPLLTSVTRHPQHQLIDGISPSPAHTATPSQPRPTGPSPTEEENRDTQFTYVLRKYDSITENRVYSPWHTFGGYKWRLLIYPKGNHTLNNDLSVYLECGGPHTRDSLSQQSPSTRPMSPNGKETADTTLPPTEWNRPARFSLHLVHPSSPIAKAAVNSDKAPSDPSLVELEVTDSVISPRSHLNPRGDVVKETSHIFRPNVSGWGFFEFASFKSLQPNGYADNDMNVVIMVKIRLLDRSINSQFTNSKSTENNQSVSRSDAGVMNVSPHATPDTIPTDENKENGNAQPEQTLLQISVTRHSEQQRTDGTALLPAHTATATWFSRKATALVNFIQAKLADGMLSTVLQKLLRH